ncbi:hypothetical protein Hanom_Chr15g01342711 [Helianthus anomalus]
MVYKPCWLQSESFDGVSRTSKKYFLCELNALLLPTCFDRSLIPCIINDN